MPLSANELRTRLSAQEWTAHNIRLTPEISTMPGHRDFVDSDLRLKAVVRVLHTLFGADLSGIRVADMGCLEGGFSLALALLGAVVTGVEARKLNMEKLQLLVDHFGLENLSFVRSDVKDFRNISTEYEAVLALGILYHLDEPSRWLKQLAQITRRVLLIDTHFAPADEEAMEGIDPRLNLGPLEEREADGWRSTGRWYTEFPEGTDPEPQLWASWSNNRSFWLTKESILLSLQRAGFSLILEQHDYSVGLYDHYNRVFPRCMLLAIKSSSAGG